MYELKLIILTTGQLLKAKFDVLKMLAEAGDTSLATRAKYIVTHDRLEDLKSIKK